MGRGLTKKRYPVFGLGIDTKSDPKIMPPGGLLELENMYQQRTGELVMRNGFTTLPLSATGGGGVGTGGLDNLYALPGGTLEALATASGFDAEHGPKIAVKYLPSTAGLGGSWVPANEGQFGLVFPRATVNTTGIQGAARSTATPPTYAGDLADPDMCVGGALSLATWVETGASNPGRAMLRELAGGQAVVTQYNEPTRSARPMVAVAAGPTFNAFFWTDNASPPNLKCDCYNGSVTTAATLVAAGVATAQPWFDCKAIPGTNKVAVAFRANAGGVSCLVFDLSTNTVTTAAVNTAGADATMCLGWLDDSFATGNIFLATAGGTAGIVVRVMSATTLAVSATNVIDAATLANVRQITGHLLTNAPSYVVLYDVDATPTYNMLIKYGQWTGAPSLATFIQSFGLYSRTFIAPDGKYYFIASYDSTTQATYSLMGAAFDSFTGIASPSQAQIFSGFAGGRRAATCSLTSVITVNGVCYTALAKKQKITTAGGVVVALRAVVQAAITFSSQLRRPRELGGTVFFPGGIVCRDDGTATGWAVCPFSLEIPTFATGGGGAMTSSAVYFYRLVLKRIDATGRITRSSGSVAASTTLGVTDTAVTITMQNPRLQPAGGINFIIEIYRAGPEASGATGYNKVGEAYPNQFSGGNTLAFVDTLSDVNAALGEVAYFTGGTLENLPPPSCNLLEVCGPRVWIVNAEYPTELWFSKEYKPGAGIGFHSDNTLRVEGDGRGPLTALAAMDGRLIPFKDGAIYAISGDGPNDLGVGSFTAPQAVSLSIGTTVPGSVVATPDGIMFQSRKGIYLLDRGLGLSTSPTTAGGYIGAPVEAYTSAANVVDASLVDGTTQVRFVMANGRVLVWDYYQKRWYTFLVPVGASTVVACVNSAIFGWCYATADGVVRQETPGATTDDGASIIPRIAFPHLQFAGVNGYQRFYGLDIEGEFVGTHTLSCQFEYDGNSVLTTPQTRAIAAGSYSYELAPAPQASGQSGQRCMRVRPILTIAGASTAGGFKLTGIGVTIGIKSGNNIPYTSRLT